jgi:hypothetical protein
MSSTYNGTSAAITPHLAVAITEPDDGDPAAAASVNVGLSKLADYMQWLQEQSALKDSVNGFSREQALLALGAALTLNAAGPQFISKIGSGTLTIENVFDAILMQSAPGANAYVRSGTAGATLTLAPSGASFDSPLAMGAHAITGVADPGAAQDAATRNYVDGIGGLSTSCGSVGLTGSYADITNLSVTATFRGRPVLIMLVPDGSIPSNVFALAAMAGTLGINLQCLRDSTTIAEVVVLASGNVILAQTGCGLQCIDVPAPGAHTYKIQGKLNNGDSGGIEGYKLFVRELL